MKHFYYFLTHHTNNVISEKQQADSIHSRHDDNTEVQPVPWISQEGELAYAETPSQDFDEGLKGVDCGKCMPVEKQMRMSTETFPLSTHVMRCVCQCCCSTHSNALAHSGGWTCVINAQLAMMVHMITRLNSVQEGVKEAAWSKVICEKKTFISKRWLPKVKDGLFSFDGRFRQTS